MYFCKCELFMITLAYRLIDIKMSFYNYTGSLDIYVNKLLYPVVILLDRSSVTIYG